MSLGWPYWLVFFLLPFVLGFFFVVLSKSSSADPEVQRKLGQRKKRFILGALAYIVTALIFLALRHYIQLFDETS